MYLATLVSQVSFDISQKAYYLFKRTIYNILYFSVTIWVKKKIKNVVRYLTSNLIKSGLQSRIFQWPTEVNKVKISSLKHAESFEIPMICLYSSMCYEALVIKCYCYLAACGYEIH